MTSKPLTPKQARFVDEYLIDLNATQAAVRAGYSSKTAHVAGPRLLANVRVGAAIAERQSKRAERTKVDTDYVVTNLKEIVERCMERAPVMVKDGNRFVQKQDDDGNDVWQFDARGAVAALNTLAKHTGGFSDEVKHVQPDGPFAVTVTHVIVDPKRPA